ncbi:MAG: hypothetical protein JSS65_04455 [Armatimonadetes bacterium]|nr:hypothetical protein [Armatimonadota bacterium]
MFSPFLIAAAMAGWQANDPILRVARFVGGTNHYKATFSVTDIRKIKIADCTWEVVKPGIQRLTGSGKGYDYEFIQTPDATVFFANHVKTYLEWPAFSRLIPPPPNAQLLAQVYPGFLIDPKSMQRFKWSQPVKKTIGGAQVDESTAEESSQMGTVNVRLAVDAVGQIVQFYVKSAGQMGTTEYTYDFTKHERLATNENTISARLKEGYVPYNVAPTYSPITASEPAPETTVTEVATGKSTKLEFQNKITVVVFTAPECEISKTMQKALAKAESKFGKEAKFVEISLGRDKPSGQGREGSRTLYWDKDGSVEKTWGINYTPYVLVVGKDGTISRGFGGFGPDQEEPFLKTIATAVKSAGE